MSAVEDLVNVTGKVSMESCKIEGGQRRGEEYDRTLCPRG